MTELPRVSETLEKMADMLYRARDREVSMAAEVLVQYITDPSPAAYRSVDRQVNALARAFDRLISKCQTWAKEAQKIENSVENFYGD